VGLHHQVEFEDVPEGVRRIPEDDSTSPEGATRLLWRRDGSEILFLSRDMKMIAISVRTSPELKVDPPVTLFTLPEGQTWFDFDVTSDGQRFFVIERLQTAGLHPASAILNWNPKKSQ
jgi:hypothetical protein